MDDIIILLAGCILFLVVVIGLWVLFKKAMSSGLGMQRYAGQITAEVNEALRNPENRRRVDEELQKKLNRNSLKKTLIVLAVVAFTCFCMMMIQGIGIGALAVLAVFGAACAILIIKDRIKMKPDNSVNIQGPCVEKAYICYVMVYHGYRVVIAYYDYLQNIIHTEMVVIDYSDVDTVLRKGDYLDIVVREKKGRVQYVQTIKYSLL